MEYMLDMITFIIIQASCWDQMNGYHRSSQLTAIKYNLDKIFT